MRFFTVILLFGTSRCMEVSTHLPADINEPVGEAFVSYSIEFSWFPEYAGNLSNPNTFTNNLLSNFKALTGTKPYVRVGGNTQDNSLYDPNLKVATNRIFGNPDIPYPTTMTYGKSFFESYQTFDDAKFTFGFNLGANETNGGLSNLAATLPLACKAIGKNLAYWEMGNEADHFNAPKSNRPAIRDNSTWTPAAYVNDWKSRVDMMSSIYRASRCGDKPFRFLGPSFAGLRWVNPAFESGYNDDGRIGAITTHHYIAGSQDPTVSLQGTLMNHSMTAVGIESQRKIKTSLADTGLPYIIGEGNSLFNQGRPGVSDVFGAALWSIDFSLLAASLGIQRVHFHQGVDYGYSSWQPVQYEQMVPGTKAPYYGNIAAAATLGNTKLHDVQVSEIDLSSESESAFAIYQDGRLAHIAVLNMMVYNSTSSQTRPDKEYTFTLSNSYGPRRAKVQRLMASGSDAVSGITWDGYSYNYELAEGRPVRLENSTLGCTESVLINDGRVAITVPHSSYALINFL